MPGISAPTCPPAWRALRHRNRTDAPSSRFPPDRCSIEPVEPNLRLRLLVLERPARLNQPPQRGRTARPWPPGAAGPGRNAATSCWAARPGVRTPALTSASRPGVIARSSPLSRSRSRSWSRTSDHIQLTRWSRRRRSSSPLSRSTRSCSPTRSHTWARPSPVIALHVTTGVVHPSSGRPSKRSAPASSRAARRASAAWEPSALPGGRGCWPAISPESGGSRSPRWPVASGALDYLASYREPRVPGRDLHQGGPEVSTTAIPDRFTTLPDEPALQATVVALEEHGFSVEVVGDLDAARQAVLARIPEGSSVMTSDLLLAAPGPSIEPGWARRDRRTSRCAPTCSGSASM